MVRSTLAALAAVTLLAAPAAAAAPDRGAETARAGWVIDLGGLLERAWGLLFGERGSEEESRPPLNDRAGRDLGYVFGADVCDAECEARGGLDPNG
jgi:hypothetical protein